LELGDAAAAIAYYRIVVAAAEQDWSAWNNLGNALEAAGDLTGAISAAPRRATGPDSPPIRVNLVNVLFAAGELDAAET
jgi:Flp pilus assembly protein TadD